MSALIVAAERLRSGRSVEMTPEIAAVLADWLMLEADWEGDAVSYAADLANLINGGAA